MRRYLRELGFIFDDSDLDQMIPLLAGAQQQRVEAQTTRVDKVTRSTAIVALANLAPEISQGLQEAGLDWQGFRDAIGLSGEITPMQVDDVDLHQDFETALAMFAKRHPDRRRPTTATLASAITEMIAQEPETGVLGRRFAKFGADRSSLPTDFPEAETTGEATPKATGGFEPAAQKDDMVPEDPLLERLLSRRLAVSTVTSGDINNAQSLLDGPERWGLGPGIKEGDIVLVYFPETLANDSQLRAEVQQKSGLRFLLRAAAASRNADASDNFRQVVAISQRLELPQPVEPAAFTVPPLADWSLPKRQFQGAGQEEETLSPNLARALWSVILETNPDLRTDLEAWVAEDLSQQPEISTHATSDLWTVNDKLGYAEYARAIYQFLDDPRTEPPLTISIQAPWGGGKTSLMRMVQKQLDPKGYELWSASGGHSLADTLKATTRNMLDELTKLTKQMPTTITLDLGPGTCASVWFNAWRYQSSDQIWAGLAEAIIRGITDRLKPVDREKFLLRLHLSRVNPDLIRTKVYDAMSRRFLDLARRFGLWVLLGLVVLAGALWNQTIPIWGAQIPASLSAIILGIIGAASAYLTARKQTADEPASLNLSDYVEVPDYSEKLGFIHHVTEDLRRVFELLPPVKPDREEPRVPLVIFIDDLDRCGPAKVAEVFEAINLFIAGEFPNCYVVIGMDTEVVAAALEEAHMNVIRRLPSYARRIPVGWRFMDKFVQLPFVIPPLDEKAVSDYADHLAAAEDRHAREVQARAAGDSARIAEAHIRKSLDQGKDESEIVKETTNFYVTEEDAQQGKAMEEGLRLAQLQLESIRRQRYIDERARSFRSDSDKIQSLLLGAKEDFSNNPRELKRLVNVYRFYYNLRLARQSRNQAVPTELQLRNWLKLSLAWPEVVRWLRRSYSEWESGLDSKSETRTAIGYRLTKLENLAVAQVKDCEDAGSSTMEMRNPTIRDWAVALRAEFGLPENVPWMNDERLFAFLRTTASGDAEQRLSSGSGQGFW